MIHVAYKGIYGTRYALLAEDYDYTVVGRLVKNCRSENSVWVKHSEYGEAFYIHKNEVLGEGKLEV